MLGGRIWSVLTNCLDDYTVDSRGDVGSWIRIATCESLPSIYGQISIENPCLTIGKVLRLSVERMDRVRIVAGHTLLTLIPRWKDADHRLSSFITSYCNRCLSNGR